LLLDHGGGRFNLVGICHISGQHQCRASQSLNFLAGAFQAIATAGNQAKVCTTPGKGSHGGTAHPGRRARNDHNRRAGAYLTVVDPQRPPGIPLL
jgi:hypothetical protein